jgi:hypothetical protein
MLMGSTSMTGEEVDALTSPTVSYVLVPQEGGRVTVLVVEDGGGVTTL